MRYETNETRARRRSTRILALAAIAAPCALIALLYAFIPRAHDHEAPELSLGGIGEAAAFRDSFALSYAARDEASGLAILEASIDGIRFATMRLEGREAEGELSAPLDGLPEGPHALALVARDASIWANEARVEEGFVVDRSPPILEASPVRPSVAKGGSVAVRLRSSEPLALAELISGAKSVPFYGTGEALAYEAMMASGPLAKAGPLALLVRAQDAAGNAAELEVSALIAERAFPRETIRLPAAKKGIYDDQEKIALDRDALALALAARSPERLWKGPFVVPVEGVMSSKYGSQRYYVTGGLASYHQGIDYANVRGTRVFAANRGVVAFSSLTVLYGNLVVIDHGQGLFSMYAHLDKALVEAGSPIERGEPLGLMGDTGYSTAPHLHWECKLYGQDIDPLDLIAYSEMIAASPGDR